TLKDNPDIGKYITTLEDHIATIDNMLFSSDKQNIENLQKMKEQLASIPQTVASTKLDTIIAELQTKEPFSGESQYALDLLTNADSFEEFSSSVETLGKEFDNEFTALHNDIVSGKVTAPLYERFRNEYRQSISYFSKQNSTLSSESGNKGVEPSGGKQETENGGAKPQNTEGSKLNPEAKGSGNNGLGGRNGEPNSEPANRTAGNGTSVEIPQEQVKVYNSKLETIFKELYPTSNNDDPLNLKHFKVSDPTQIFSDIMLSIGVRSPKGRLPFNEKLTKAEDIAKQIGLDTSHVNIPLLKEIEETGGYVMNNTDLAEIKNRVGNFSVIVKDVNGNRARMSIDDFQKWKQYKPFSDRIRNVFINSGSGYIPSNI
ncbi:MAG: hypothetical protein KGI08_11245, partial [Thaumarchaeota archaeon]|nr:hypothetical protein [Nitrososphaerota archaeon]